MKNFLLRFFIYVISTLEICTGIGQAIHQKLRYHTASVSDRIKSVSGSGSGFGVRIRIQEGKNDLQKLKKLSMS